MDAVGGQMGQNDVEVEWIIAADAAQVVGQKLYLLGGGWNVLTVNQEFPVDHLMGIAASLSIPWNATNEAHDVRIDLVDEDHHVLMSMNGKVEVGRPPGLPPMIQRSQVAMNLSLKIPHIGTYAIIVSVNGEEKNRTTFAVILNPALAFAQQRGNAGA